MKLRYSEVFYSIQGEGRFVGTPSIFLRVFGCNFECRGFGQERDNLIPVEEMPYFTDPKADKNHPEAYTSIEELPVTWVGCDTSASWAMKYKHLQTTETLEEVFDRIVKLLPNGRFDEKNDIHLVITGGEPLLGWQRCWPTLLEMCREVGLKNVTFETNGTQMPKPELIDYFNDEEGFKIHVTWSTSPKLSLSGEDRSEALDPSVLKRMNSVRTSHLYSKFVVRDITDFEEVDIFVKAYEDNFVDLNAVYCMPEGATLEQQSLTEKDVAEACLKTGYKFSPRLHITLFGNEWGT